MMSSADQASRLRQLFSKKQAPGRSGDGSARVIAVSGGKGGVGKTNVAANLAISFASRGQKVALLDADYALANVDILLGLSPKFTIENVLEGNMSVGEIMVDGPGGIKVVPASSGVQKLTKLSNRQLNNLYNALQVLEKHFDQLIIDTAAGMSEEVISLLHAAGEVIMVTNPEPPAFVDSYALIKHLVKVEPTPRIRVLVNLVRGERESLLVYDRIAKTVEKFLKRKIEYMGHIAEDEAVKNAVRNRRPFVLHSPKSPASLCINKVAEVLLRDNPEKVFTGFWRNLKTVMTNSR
jgi:flagellar biosynthesis protein FlhG